MSSSIQPPFDGGYDYYRQKIDDLDNEKNSIEQRGNQQLEERTDKLKSENTRDRNNLEEQFKKAVANERDNWSDAIHRERENNRVELDKIKSQHYNRFGKYDANENDILKSELMNVKSQMDAQDRKNHANLDETATNYQNKMIDEDKANTDELAKNVQAARDSANQSMQQAFDNEHSQSEDDRATYNKNYNRLDETRINDQNDQRRFTQNAIEDQQRGFDKRIQSQEKASDARFERRDRALAETDYHDAEQNRIAREEEGRQLRDQMKALVSDEGRYVKEKGQGTADAVREYNDDWRDTLDRAQDSYTAQLDRLKEREGEAQASTEHKHNDAMREKEAYFSGAIRKQNQDNHQEVSTLKNSYDRAFEARDQQFNHEAERIDQAREAQLIQATEARNSALTNQAKAYGQTLNRNNQASGAQIKALQKQIQEGATSSDNATISPALETKIRNSTVKEYEKTFNTENNRNRETIDTMEKSYANRYDNQTAEHQAFLAKLTRKQASERDMDRNEFVNAMSDNETLKDSILHDQEYHHQRENENLRKSDSKMIERQRREYEELLQSSRNEANSRITGQRQDLEYQLNTNQRAFATRESELIRNYEKQLANQKEDYEAKLEDMKDTTQTELRNSEKSHRNELEQQAHLYEQKMAQNEAQHKERERYISENNQDQLDKIRRSNALLQSKKG